MDDGWGAREEGRVGYFEPPKIIFVRKIPPVTAFLYAVVFLILCGIFAMLVRLNVLAAEEISRAENVTTPEVTHNSSCSPLGGSFFLCENGDSFRLIDGNAHCASYARDSAEFRRFRSFYAQCIANWTRMGKDYPDCAFKIAANYPTVDRFYVPMFLSHQFLFGASPATLKYLYMLVDDNCMLNEKQTEAFFDYFL